MKITLNSPPPVPYFIEKCGNVWVVKRIDRKVDL